ncbi:MAG TPA: VWA domain-containing protein [Candidatus Melainabacteria bacterium]|nr:VWA domain-containing protein [Candidatus Melainabacteria bacterium]
MKINSLRRNARGQSMVVLMTFLTLFLVLVLGMVAFEFSRYSLCSQQFQHCVDIAAIGGAVGLASSNNTDLATSQAIAKAVAQRVFERNYILDHTLKGNSTFNTSAASPPTPGANKAIINFAWLDPETGVPTSNPGDQKVFRVTGAYGYPCLVGNYIGLGANAVLRCSATGNGGGTMLDVILCFDLSASIDDSTKVSMVERYYTNTKKNQYRVAGSGMLYEACGATNDTGTPLNACYPQQLENDEGKTFNAGQRGRTQGDKPGVEGLKGGRNFTDIVVNLDENDNFGGTTVTTSYGTFEFPTIGALVEGARGNLETLSLANSANVDLTAIGVSNPRAGFYRAYWESALTHRHPLYDAQASAANFFQILNNSTNAHFGLVCFSTDEKVTYTGRPCIGSGQNHSITTSNAGTIPTGSSVSCPTPYVALDKTAGATGSNFSQIQTFFPPTNPPASPQLTAYNGTDINGSLTLALQNLLPGSKISGGLDNMRNGATPAVVLFTDGRPTANTGIGDQDGNYVAGVAKNNGVKIYCIGLAQVDSIIPKMNAVLGNIANQSGGKYYPIPPGTGQATALNKAFSDIARSLVTLTK